MLTFRRAAMLALGTVALVGAGVGSASAETTVQVRLPNGVHAKSLYVYQGEGPAGNSNWDHCFPVGSQVVVPATPGQRQWNFYAYADSDCPIDGVVTAKKTNVTAPPNLANWSVTLQ